MSFFVIPCCWTAAGESQRTQNVPRWVFLLLLTKHLKFFSHFYRHFWTKRLICFQISAVNHVLNKSSNENTLKTPSRHVYFSTALFFFLPFTVFSPVIFDSFESLLNYGVLREKEEIQVSDPSYPGGAHRGAFCQRRPLLQAPAAGWRFCRYFFQVNTPENNLKRFFTHAKHCLKYHVVVSYSLEAVTGG